MIAEIILYSYGYLNAPHLARKVVSTFKLSSEILSTQDWYDYGLRGIGSVLRAAGNLKQHKESLSVNNTNQSPLGSPVLREVAEEELVLRALVEVNLPK
jgi:dynein heavy chain